MSAQVQQEISQAVYGHAAPQALAKTFSRSFQQTLIYEIVVYLLALGLVFTLPRDRPAPDGCA